MTVDPIQIANCNSREVNLQAHYLLLCPKLNHISIANLWLEGYIRGGDVGVAHDVSDGAVETLDGEGGTHREYHHPGGSPGLWFGFSSISKALITKDF